MNEKWTKTVRNEQESSPKVPNKTEYTQQNLEQNAAKLENALSYL